MGLRTDQVAGQKKPAPLPEFEQARQQANQRANANAQQQGEALNRRFAAGGMLNSGAAVKQTAVQNEALNQQKEQAIGGIDAQEAAAQRGIQDKLNEQAFASSEAEKGRQFASGESALSRKMAEDQFGKTFGASQEQFGKTFGASEAQRAISNKLAEQENEMNLRTTKLNEATAIANAKNPAKIQQYINNNFPGFQVAIPQKPIAQPNSYGFNTLSRRTFEGR